MGWKQRNSNIYLNRGWQPMDHGLDLACQVISSTLQSLDIGCTSAVGQFGSVSALELLCIWLQLDPMCISGNLALGRSSGNGNQPVLDWAAPKSLPTSDLNK